MLTKLVENAIGCLLLVMCAALIILIIGAIIQMFNHLF